MAKWSLMVFAAIAVAFPDQFHSSSLHKLTIPSTQDSCYAVRPYLKILDSLSSTAVFQTGLEQIKERAQNDKAREHLISFGMDSMGKVVLSNVSVGTSNNTSVPSVANAFADLHNHPKNTPPSSGDVYGLLQLNKRNSGYRFRFVLTASHTLYALVVTDTSAARQFEVRFPFQHTKGYSPLFPDSLLNEYREIVQRYNTPEQFAMAYMLEKYNAGVCLFKKNQSGYFTMVKTKLYVVNNEKNFVPATCP